MNGGMKMGRRFLDPDEAMGPDRKNGPFHQGVRCGDLVWISGLVAHDRTGSPGHQGDMRQQTQSVMDSLRRSLEKLGASMDDLVKVNSYYVGEDRRSEAIDTQSGYFDRGPAFTGVVVPRLGQPELLIQVDAIAMIDQPKEYGESLGRLLGVPVPFSQAVRCGDFIHVSGQLSLDPSDQVLHPGDILSQADVVTERLRSALSGFGASMEDVVKTNAYYMGLSDWKGVVGRRARYFRKGPTSTGIVVPESAPGVAIQIDATAYTGPKSFASPENHYPFPFDVPFTHGARAGNMIFVAGQVAYDVHGVIQDRWDLPSQTKRAMDNVANVLAAFQASMDDILRLNVYYLGAADWRQSRLIQANYFDAGTTLTDVFVDGGVIPDFGDVIEIDAVAAIQC